MNEISYPVRAEESWITHGAAVWDADGRCVTEHLTLPRAEAIAQALNEVATLRAQVKRARALANRWSELADHFCRMSWGDLEAGARMMEATDSGMSGGFRQCARALRAALEGDGHPGDARGAHRAPDEGVG